MIGVPATSPFESESYVTIEIAQSYFDTRLDTKAWDKASEKNKNKALIMSTRAIDNLNFSGCKTLLNQYLQFPRNGFLIIPKDIQIATCECALQYLDQIDMEQEIAGLGSNSSNYASINTTYDSKYIPEHIVAGIPSAIAWRFLKPYLVDPYAVVLQRM